MGTHPITKKSLSYLYALDQFDTEMKKSDACDFDETAHHGKEWKGQRRRLVAEELVAEAASQPDKDALYREIDLHNEMVDRHGPEHAHRRLSVEIDEYGCFHDDSGAWGSHVKIYEDDATGQKTIYFSLDGECCASAGVEATEADCCQLGNGCCFYECECDDGLMWDADSMHCISYHWSPTILADVSVIASYWQTKESELRAASVYVKDADKERDVLPLLVQIECALLYNDKNNVTVLNSLDNRFLRGWGFETEIDKGELKRPCAQADTATGTGTGCGGMPTAP